MRQSLYEITVRSIKMLSKRDHLEAIEEIIKRCKKSSYKCAVFDIYNLLFLLSYPDPGSLNNSYYTLIVSGR